MEGEEEEIEERGKEKLNPPAKESLRGSDALSCSKAEGGVFRDRSERAKVIDWIIGFKVKERSTHTPSQQHGQ